VPLQETSAPPEERIVSGALTVLRAGIGSALVQRSASSTSLPASKANGAGRATATVPYDMSNSIDGEHRSFAAVPAERLERLEGWAMLAHSMGYVYRPSTLDGVREVLRLAQQNGRSIVPRGSGFSYGDTSMNSENLVLDTHRLNRVLDWDPSAGLVRVEPGVTIGQLWRYTLEDGWWPAVVPGTMFPTLGGCSSTNVHGKNHWRVGSLGEQILAFDLLLPSGEILQCAPQQNSDVYYAAIGGLGMLGIFVSLTLRLEKVPSGLLQIEERVADSLDDMFSIFEEALERSDHLLGWIDGYARGRSLGRGLVQLANPYHDDPDPIHTLRPSFQDLPDTILGIVPRSALWRVMKLGANDLGLRALNTARYTISSLRPGRTALVPHARFHFILDYVPNWKWAFRPGGIIQYQAFLPKETARDIYRALLEESQSAGLIPDLAVFKRHKPDPFLLSYSVDGYSLALDYHQMSKNEHRLQKMLSRFTREIVLPAGGRFYPAKDNALDRQSFNRSLSPQAMKTYLAIKQRLDPDEILQSDLYRRVFVGRGDE
jgi:decaprenylphospho-beta-D-ribofuranose 2-oxidase